MKIVDGTPTAISKLLRENEEGKELPCERNDDGRCDVCSNCFKHIRGIGYDDGKDEARRELLASLRIT